MKISRRLLFVIAILLVLAFVLSKVRIVFFVPISLGAALLILGGVVLVLFLALDHLLNRDRD